MDYVDIRDESVFRGDAFLNKHIKIFERLILKILMIKTRVDKSKSAQDFISTRQNIARKMVLRGGECCNGAGTLVNMAWSYCLHV